MTSTPERAAVPLVDFAGLYREQAHAVWRFAFHLSGDASLADNWPERFVVIAAAAALWAFYLRLVRRLRVPGL